MRLTKSIAARHAPNTPEELPMAIEIRVMKGFHFFRVLVHRYVAPIERMLRSSDAAFIIHPSVARDS
jgi:hypothetical protein